MYIPPFFVRQWLGEHVPAATSTRNNRRNVERVCLWICLCIPVSLLANSSVKTLPGNEELLEASFSVQLKESKRLVLLRTSF
jgi:hypothetical protein